jgi:sugar lactone lactonase YvrE
VGVLGAAASAAATPASYTYGPQRVVVSSGLSGPKGIAFDSVGDGFVADAYHNDVVEYPLGAPARVVVGGLDEPSDVVVDHSGNVYVIDGLNRVLKVPAGGGTPITVLSNAGYGFGIALDAAGDLFVAETSANQVVEVPANGGAPRTIGSGLTGPLGVVVDDKGDVYISDSYNHRVVEEPAGGGAQRTVATGLSLPHDLGVDAVGDLFIADGKVVEVSAQGVQSTLPWNIGSAYGLAIDQFGDVFVSDFGANQIVEEPVIVPTSVSAAPASKSAKVFSAILTSNVTGLPIRGQVITFSTKNIRGGQDVVCSAATQANGQATCHGTVPALDNLVDTSYSATFGGATLYTGATYRPSSATGSLR